MVVLIRIKKNQEMHLFFITYVLVWVAFFGCNMAFLYGTFHLWRSIWNNSSIAKRFKAM